MTDVAPDRSGPIFLAGVDRSGIGLLGEILECHPHVSMTRRTNFWSDYDGRYGDLRDTENLARCLDAMARSRRLSVFEPDVDRLRAQLGDHPTYARLFEALHVQLMERRGRRRWGDKSLGTERYADHVLSSYPTSSIVHVLRDPRDRYASQRTHRGPVRGGVGAGAALWQWSEAMANASTRSHPGRCLVVRYEDLVADPDAVLDAVGAFLGLDTSGSGGSAGPGLSTGSVGRHVRDLAADERAFIERWTKVGMSRRGYEVHQSGESGSSRFLTPTTAVASLAALNWRIRNRVRHDLAQSARRRRASSP